MLEGLTIADTSSINAEKVHVYPSFSNLKEKIFSASKSPYEVESITIEGFKIAQKDLSRIASWQGASSRDQALSVNKIALKNMSILLNSMKIPDVNGEVLLDAAGRLSKANFSTENNNFTANIQQEGSQHLIVIEATRWRAPLAPYPVFSKLNAKGAIQSDILTFSKINGALYNGTLEASLNIDLASDSLASKGQFTLNDFFLADMAEELKLDTAVEGKVSSNGSFSFNFNKSSNNIINGQLSSTFDIKNGYLKTVDLTEAMRSGNLSGYTKFTALSGKASLANQTFQFTNLLLRENQLSARGQLKLSPEHQVSGVITSTIAVKSNPIRSRLRIDGPLTGLRLKK